MNKTFPVALVNNDRTFWLKTCIPMPCMPPMAGTNVLRTVYRKLLGVLTLKYDSCVFPSVIDKLASCSSGNAGGDPRAV